LISTCRRSIAISQQAIIIRHLWHFENPALMDLFYLHFHEHEEEKRL
jgi:hypothetical protein